MALMESSTMPSEHDLTMREDELETTMTTDGQEQESKDEVEVAAAAKQILPPLKHELSIRQVPELKVLKEFQCVYEQFEKELKEHDAVFQVM